MPKTAPNCARFSIIGAYTNGRPVNSIFEALVVGDGSGSRTDELTAYAAALGPAWANNPVTRMADNYTATRIDWLDLNSATGPTGTSTVGLPATGAMASAALPPNVARLVTKTLTGSARGQRAGRVFWGAAVEANVDEDGTIVPAQLVLDQTEWTDFLTATTVTVATPPLTSARLVVIQWPSLEVAQPAKMLTNPDGVGSPVNISGFIVEAVVSTQRRRVRP